MQDSAFPAVKVNELTPITVNSARGLLPFGCEPSELSLEFGCALPSPLRAAAQ